MLFCIFSGHSLDIMIPCIMTSLFFWVKIKQQPFFFDYCLIRCKYYSVFLMFEIAYINFLKLIYNTLLK